LIPAESLARQKRVAEPLQCNERVTATLSLSQCCTQFFNPRVEVSRDRRVGFDLILKALIERRPGSTLTYRTSGIVVEPFKVDTYLILFRRPAFSRRIAAFTASIFAT